MEHYNLYAPCELIFSISDVGEHFHSRPCWQELSDQEQGWTPKEPQWNFKVGLIYMFYTLRPVLV